MSVDTAPYASAVVDLLASGFGVTLSATLTTADLAVMPVTVNACTVTLDAARSPRVEATVTLAWPDAATRSMLNPRAGLLLTISAGYRDPVTGDEDTQILCALRVQEVVTDHAGKSVSVTAQSDEAVPIGYPLDYAVTYTTASVIVTAIQEVIAAAFPGETLAWLIGDNVPRAQLFTDAAPTTYTVGMDRWSLIQEWADLLGVVVYHDGLGTWKIRSAAPVPTDSSRLRLRTGPTGTVSSVKITDTRSGWANAVAVIYTYSVAGVNKITTCIVSTALRPVAMATIAKSLPPVNAALVGKSALSRGLRRGHAVEVTATAALWVRPGHVVTVDLPDGSQERLLVEVVEFDVPAGTMVLTGQAPDVAGVTALPVMVSTVTTVSP